MTIIATFHPYVDGRTIASNTETYVFPAAGNYSLSITINELRTAERVLQWNLSTDPVTDPGTPTNVSYSQNVVGCTLIGVGQGTTLIAEAIVVGF